MATHEPEQMMIRGLVFSNIYILVSAAVDPSLLLIHDSLGWPTAVCNQHESAITLACKAAGVSCSLTCLTSYCLAVFLPSDPLKKRIQGPCAVLLGLLIYVSAHECMVVPSDNMVILSSLSVTPKRDQIGCIKSLQEKGRPGDTVLGQRFLELRLKSRVARCLQGVGRTMVPEDRARKLTPEWQHWAERWIQA